MYFFIVSTNLSSDISFISFIPLLSHWLFTLISFEKLSFFLFVRPCVWNFDRLALAVYAGIDLWLENTRILGLFYASLFQAIVSLEDV